jgi:quercetin dioxygenase-like cupin family protein
MADTVTQWREHWHSDQEVVPVAQRVILENDRVRIWEIVLEPGEELGLHTHELDYVTVTIEGSDLEAREHSGEMRAITAKPGAIQWTRAGEGQTHSLRNVGKTRFQNRLVELKQPGEGLSHTSSSCRANARSGHVLGVGERQFGL